MDPFITFRILSWISVLVLSYTLFAKFWFAMLVGGALAILLMRVLVPAR